MNNPTRKNKLIRWVIWIAVGFAVAVCLTLGLIGIDINLPNETSNAHQQWREANISGYEIHYLVGFDNLYVTVENSEITRLEDGPPTFEDNPPRTPTTILPDWYTSLPNYSPPIFPPDLSHFTVDGLFTYVEQQQLNRPLIQTCLQDRRLRVEFNPDWGYIEDIALSSCHYDYEIGSGLFCPAVGDCSIGIHVRDFKVLSDTDGR